jgi:hypothetical protein
MRRWWTVACAIGLALAGCLPDEASDPKPGQGNRTDARVADARVADAAPADAAPADAAAADAGVDAAPMSGPCTYPADCPGGDCVDGMCFYGAPAQCPDNDSSLCPEGETCGGFTTNYYCISDCELAQTCPIRPRPCGSHINCPYGSVCQGGRCINACETDLDCGGDGYCIDGQCLPYPTDIFTGDAPQPFGQPGQLYAGVGWVHLDYPIGVSLAGYGARPGPHTPYSVALGGSDRFFEGQDVRAIALSSDKDMVILIRVPLCWSTDYLLTLIAQKLQVLTKSADHPNGINYHAKLVIGGTHSHSQVARFWYLLPTTGFAVAGYDYFSKELANRYAQSFAEAAYQALQNMKPARFGYSIVDDFDPHDRIHSDRRGANPPFKDDRMLVWRVDDMQGQPMAGMVNFAMHGTHMLYPWVTGDAPAGVEVVTTDKISTEHGHPIPVMFINGNAGDVSPRGDNAVAQDWAKIQAVGYRVWPIFRDAFDHIETKPDADIEIVTHRIPLSYSIVGYDRAQGEFKSKRFTRPHYWGGFQCAVGEKDWQQEGYHDGDLDCRINLETYLHAPVPQFAKTTLTAFKIGDLVVTTLPGEPVSQLGRDLSTAVEQAAAAHGMQVHSVNFGYSQDHQLYLTPHEDWFHGGYEASMSVWGWKNGDHLKDESVKLATELFTPEKEDDDTGVKPTWFPDLADDAVAPTPTPGDAEGTVRVQPPTDATRGDLIEVNWTGGHPGVDLPVVHLERQGDGGVWTPALRPGGHVWDNWGFETLTIYHGDFQADHTWSVRWELAFDLPEGNYRVVAEGHAVGTDGQTHAYTATTNPFALHAATLQVREATVSDGMLHVKVNYPNGPSTDDGHSAFATLDATGHWLRFDADRDLADPTRQYAMLLGGPVEGAVHVAVDGPDASEADPTAVADTVAFDLVVSRDAQGQTTTANIPDWSTARFDLPAPATAGEYTVTVTDAAGNRGTAVLTLP